MLTSKDVVPVYLAACSSLASYWERHRTYALDGNPDNAEDREFAQSQEFEPSLYLEVTHMLCDYLIDQARRSNLSCFAAIFAASERLLIEGDKEVQNWVVVGLFEGLQNRCSWTLEGARDTPIRIGDEILPVYPFNPGGEVPYGVFEPYLGNESRKAWDGLIEFWGG